MISRLLITFMSLSAIATSALAGDLTERIYGMVPDQCKESCVAWTNFTLPCVEKVGNVDFDPTTGSPSISGNKIAMYFCVCSNEAIERSDACLQCVTAAECLVPPVTLDTYRSICNGQTNPSALLSDTKATC